MTAASLLGRVHARPPLLRVRLLMGLSAVVACCCAACRVNLSQRLPIIPHVLYHGIGLAVAGLPGQGLEMPLGARSCPSTRASNVVMREGLF